jgi:lysophospholipid acyltransferase (LPLAT)-like uncharacterized protein
MLESLNDNYSIVLTADVPKVARVAGRGIILLASKSGRPIYPVGMATRRRIEFDTWDRSTVGLPFSRTAVVVGEAVRVSPDADEAAQEAARLRLQSELDAVTARAYAIVDGTTGGAPRG